MWPTGKESKMIGTMHNYKSRDNDSVNPIFNKLQEQYLMDLMKNGADVGIPTQIEVI
jgi:hypothetical protein